MRGGITEVTEREGVKEGGEKEGMFVSEIRGMLVVRGKFKGKKDAQGKRDVWKGKLRVKIMLKMKIERVMFERIFEG